MEVREECRWVVTLNVVLSDPLTSAQQRKLERVLLAADIRSDQVVRLHVVVDEPGRMRAIERALRRGRQALVEVDAWFERVDVFDARTFNEWRSWRDGGPQPTWRP